MAAMGVQMRRFLLVAIAIGAYVIFRETEEPHLPPPKARSEPEETYRLVHAIGNTERILEKGMWLAACRARRDEHKIIVAALGAGGSVTCLPDSAFND